MPDAPLVPAEAKKKPVLQAALADYVPATFLLWAVYGMVRPAFDHAASFDPIFWYVGGACLLTLYGRFMTRDIRGDDDDGEENLDEKWRFNLPHLWREYRR